MKEKNHNRIIKGKNKTAETFIKVSAGYRTLLNEERYTLEGLLRLSAQNLKKQSRITIYCYKKDTPFLRGRHFRYSEIAF